jgi:ATP-dependent protease ClpP protease subunit
MYKDFKHIKNVSEDGKSATMLLTGRIGNTYNEDGTVAEYGIRGDMFANEMLYLKAIENVDTIEVEINSVGGDVTNDGYNIVNSIIKHKANTKVVGLAASMAGLCAIAGEKRSIVDYGSIMCHPVSGGNGDDKVLGIIQDSLKTLYMGRTRMNGDTVDNIFSKETWYSNSKNADYSLQDAVDAGIVDEIVPTKKKFKALSSAKRDLATLTNIYNSLNTNTKKMEYLKKALNLKNDLSDEGVEKAAVETIETLQAEKADAVTAKEAAEAKVLELQGKLDAIEAAKEAEKTAAATAAVENAIKTGKVKKEQEADMIVLAKTNLSAFNALVAVAPSKKEAVQIPFGGGVENASNADERASWDYITWSKKDPEALMNMKNNTPEAYQALLDNLKTKTKK